MHSRALPLARWAGPAALAASALAVLFAARWSVAGDFAHMYEPARAVAEGRWGGLYPTGALGTSPPGWALAAGLPMAGLAAAGLGGPEAYLLAGLAWIPALVVAVRLAATSLWPHCTAALGWGLGVAAVAAPTSWSVWTNFYHPQDLAATVLVVLGLAAVGRGRWGWAGVAFGLAVVTRQWALLAAVPVAGLAGRHLWRVAAGAGFAAGALVVPALVAGNPGLTEALAAADTQARASTVVGRLRLAADGGWLGGVARVLPALGAGGVGAWAWLRRWRGVDAVIPLALSGLALRMLFESANYLYYWAPFAPLALLLAPRSRWGWAVAGGLGVGPWLVQVLTGGPFLLGGREAWVMGPEGLVPASDAGDLAQAGLTTALAVLALAAPWWVVRISPPSTPPAPIAPTAPLWGWAAAGGLVAAAFLALALNVAPLGAADAYRQRQDEDRTVHVGDEPPVPPGARRLPAADGG